MAKMNLTPLGNIVNEVWGTEGFPEELHAYYAHILNKDTK